MNYETYRTVMHTDLLTRNIVTDNPVRTAAIFASLISRNPVNISTIEGKGMVYTMKDGSVVVHRYFSSLTDGSPVVELNVINFPDVKNQKIHFVKE